MGPIEAACQARLHMERPAKPKRFHHLAGVGPDSGTTGPL
jgi:hypothetical protein